MPQQDPPPQPRPDVSDVRAAADALFGNSSGVTPGAEFALGSAAPVNSTPRFSFQRVVDSSLRIGCGILTAATLLAFAGPWGWFPDLFSHFRMQYLLASLLTVGGAALTRRWKWLAWSMALLASNLVVVAPLYVAPDHPEQSAATFGGTLRAMLFNVNTHEGDPARVAQLISREQPDVLLLEEVSDEWLLALQPTVEVYPYRECVPRPDNFGIALFSKWPFVSHQVVEIGDAGVPSVVAEIESPSGKFTLIGTHPLPPIGAIRAQLRDQQLQELVTFIDAAPSPVLLLGDLNVTPFSSRFSRLITDSGLRDSSRGFGFQPSWPSNNFLLRIPIDHCLHAAEIKIVKRHIGADSGSDHLPLLIEFSLQQ